MNIFHQNKKIKVLQILYGLSLGGAEISVSQYISSLGDKKFEHYVYCFGSDGPVRIRLEKVGAKVTIGKRIVSIKNPLMFFIKLIILISDLIKFINKNEIKVIQSHLGHANHLSILISVLCNIPVFPTIHSTMPFFDPRRKYDLRKYFRKILNRILYRIPDIIIAVSDEVKTEIIRALKLPANKILVIQNGIVYDYRKNYLETVRKNKTLKDSNINIVAVGRLAPLKNFDTIIKSIYKLKKKNVYGIKLLICGDGIEYLKLKELVLKLNLSEEVKLLGYRDDIFQILQMSHIFVIASDYEGLSLAMIEAMACGLPIIASNSPGLSNYIIEGENGMLFKTRDSNDLTDCLYTLINKKEKIASLSKGSIKEFDKKYNMKKNIIPLKVILEKLFF